MTCKHIAAMAPLKDNTGWTVGYYCTNCLHTEMRKDMPKYKVRMKKKLEDEDEK